MGEGAVGKSQIIRIGSHISNFYNQKKKLYLLTDHLQIIDQDCRGKSTKLPYDHLIFFLQVKHQNLESYLEED